MIKLLKLNGEEFILNCDLIETIEKTPDTIITLTNGKKFLVKDSIETIINKVVIYKQHLYKPILSEV